MYLSGCMKPGQSDVGIGKCGVGWSNPNRKERSNTGIQIKTGIAQRCLSGFQGGSDPAWFHCPGTAARSCYGCSKGGFDLSFWGRSGQPAAGNFFPENQVCQGHSAHSPGVERVQQGIACRYFLSMVRGLPAITIMAGLPVDCNASISSSCAPCKSRLARQ